jgi:hypothetical protein
LIAVPRAVVLEARDAANGCCRDSAKSAALHAKVRAQGPPVTQIPEDERPITAPLYNDPNKADGVPFTDTEWWYSTVNVTAREQNGKTRDLAIISVNYVSNLGINGTGMTMSIRDINSGERWEDYRPAKLSADPSARFTGKDGWTGVSLDPSWRGFADDTRSVGLDPESVIAKSKKGAYFVRTTLSSKKDDVAIDLLMPWQDPIYYGDAGLPKGYADINPTGLPYWSMYKRRRATVEGSITLRDKQGEPHKYIIESGSARFDHQTTQASFKDLSRGLDKGEKLTLAKEVLTRRNPMWHWYQSDLADGTNLIAFQTRAGLSGTVWRQTVTLADKKGRLVSGEDIAFKFDGFIGKPPGAVKTTLTFTVPKSDTDVAPGNYELRFTYDTSIDWNVNYRLNKLMKIEAQEAHCKVEVWRDGVRQPDAKATQEMMDTLKGLRPAW